MAEEGKDRVWSPARDGSSQEPGQPVHALLEQAGQLQYMVLDYPWGEIVGQIEAEQAQREDPLWVRKPRS